MGDSFFIIYFLLSIFSIIWSVLGFLKKVVKKLPVKRIEVIKKPLPVTDEVTDEDIITAMPVKKEK